MLKKTLKHNKRIFCIVANAGATNSGAIDDISALADLAKLYNIWLYVDGAYSLAALADSENSKLFSGIDRADSPNPEHSSHEHGCYQGQCRRRQASEHPSDAEEDDRPGNGMNAESTGRPGHRCTA